MSGVVKPSFFTDVSFASNLMKKALAAQAQQGASNSLNDSRSSTSGTTTSNAEKNKNTNNNSSITAASNSEGDQQQTQTSLSESEEEGESTASVFKWPHSTVLLLVETFRSHESDLISGKVSSRKVWDKISRLMIDSGLMVSGPQCSSKFASLKKTFKSVSDHNSKSGREAQTWTYFQLMQSLLGERPFMEPPALSSSSSGSTRTVRVSSHKRTIVDELALAAGHSGKRSHKRKTSEETYATNPIAEALLESSRISVQNKQRRHVEKMAKRDAMNEAILQRLDALLAKANSVQN